MTKSNNSLGKVKSFLASKVEKLSLKKCSFSKPFIAASFLLFGIGGTLLTQTLVNNSKPSASQQIEMLTQWQKEVNQWMRDFHKSQIDRSDRFFEDFYSEPFIQIDQVHQRMRERFEDFDKYFNSHFNEIRPISLSSRTQISQKEDDDFLYYQLNFKGFDKEDVITNIKDNILTFSAKKSDQEVSQDNGVNSQLKSNSNFHYSFSLPMYIDVKNPDISRQDNNIVVKFKKN